MEHAVLVDVTKKVSLKEIPFTSDKFFIGRGLQNGFVIENPDVSRTHCIFEKNNGEWSISDKSTNGTWLNGQLLDKTKSHKLTTGDIVGLNENVKFVFKISSNNIRATNSSEEMALSEDDILNIADSVLADVQAFQAEYAGEKFDDEVFAMPTENRPFVDANLNVMNMEASETVVDLMQQPQPVLESNCIQQPCKSNIPDPPVDFQQNATAQPLVQTTNLDCVEDELQCSICTEMFIQAMTLSCSHTFCKYCISQWEKTHKICPICRAKITMKFPTRVVDSFIEKALENASDELKEHRREIIKQREELSAAGSSNASTSNSRRRPAQGPIEISSEEDTTEEDENNSYFDDDENMSDYSGSDWERDYDQTDWYEYNGLPGPYYGGYGHCYACGQRGHWANGCPSKRH